MAGTLVVALAMAVAKRMRMNHHWWHGGRMAGRRDLGTCRTWAATHWLEWLVPGWLMLMAPWMPSDEQA